MNAVKRHLNFKSLMLGGALAALAAPLAVATLAAAIGVGAVGVALRRRASSCFNSLASSVAALLPGNTKR